MSVRRMFMRPVRAPTIDVTVSDTNTATRIAQVSTPTGTERLITSGMTAPRAYATADPTPARTTSARDSRFGSDETRDVVQERAHVHRLARRPVLRDECAQMTDVLTRSKCHPRHVCPARPGREEPNCHPLWVA